MEGHFEQAIANVQSTEKLCRKALDQQIRIINITRRSRMAVSGCFLFKCNVGTNHSPL